MFRFLENALVIPKIESRNFTQVASGKTFPQVPSLPRQREIAHSPREKRGRKTMICFIKIQSGNMAMTWNIRLFIIYMICNFFRYDDYFVNKTSIT